MITSKAIIIAMQMGIFHLLREPNLSLRNDLKVVSNPKTSIVYVTIHKAGLPLAAKLNAYQVVNIQGHTISAFPLHALIMTVLNPPLCTAMKTIPCAMTATERTRGNASAG